MFSRNRATNLLTFAAARVLVTLLRYLSLSLQETFDGLDLEEDEDYDVEQMINHYQKQGGKVKGTTIAL